MISVLGNQPGVKYPLCCVIQALWTDVWMPSVFLQPSVCLLFALYFGRYLQQAMYALSVTSDCVELGLEFEDTI